MPRAQVAQLGRPGQPLESPEEAVRLYTVREAAALLNVGKTYLYEQVAAGNLRSVELGSGRSKRRVRADDLQRFIDSRTH